MSQNPPHSPGPIKSLLSPVRAIVDETMGTFGVPGIVVVVADHDGLIDHLVVGVDGVGQPLALNRLFPVASITKLATSLAIHRLIDAGALAIDDPLGRYFPNAAAAQTGVTIRRLLSHNSGLPIDLAEIPGTYAPGLTWPKLAAQCLQTPLAWPPDTRVQYSNVGYGILAAIVERLTGQGFPDALRSLVLDPLHVPGTIGAEPPTEPVVIADVRGAHRGTALEPFNTAFWRSLALPWAGLLTTPEGALALVHAYLGVPAGFLRSATWTEAIRNQDDNLSGGFTPPLMWPQCPWGLGPELRDAKNPHWAPIEAGPDSFGHAGASGCVAWAEPVADICWAILGSRTSDNGWLVRRGPSIGAAILKSFHPL